MCQREYRYDINNKMKRSTGKEFLISAKKKWLIL